MAPPSHPPLMAPPSHPPYPVPSLHTIGGAPPTDGAIHHSHPPPRQKWTAIPGAIPSLHDEVPTICAPFLTWRPLPILHLWRPLPILHTRRRPPFPSSAPGAEIWVEETWLRVGYVGDVARVLCLGDQRCGAGPARRHGCHRSRRGGSRSRRPRERVSVSALRRVSACLIGVVAPFPLLALGRQTELCTGLRALCLRRALLVRALTAL
jgi:hypothetical protein